MGLFGRAHPPNRLGVVLVLLSEDDGPRDVVGVVLSPVDDPDEVVVVPPQSDMRRHVPGLEVGSGLAQELLKGVGGLRHEHRRGLVANDV